MRVYFFGCIGRPGHGMFGTTEGRSDATSMTYEGLSVKLGPTRLDGGYCPTNRKQGSAKLTHANDYTVLAWHDYTGDSRPGSNSALIAEGRHTFEKMTALLGQAFADVHARQPVPLTETA